MVFLLSAMVMGLAGSLHCVAMCGPLVMKVSTGRNMASMIMYHGSRIVSYMIIGLVFGMLGQGLRLFVYQQVLSVISGILILVALVYPWIRMRLSLPQIFPYTAIYSRLMPVIKKKPVVLSQAGMGMLNGFLPCGLVYMAAAASFYKGSAMQSIGFMAFFGMGTLPAMLGVLLLGGINLSFLKRPVYWKNGALTVIAMLFILRGMALGVPYLSPKVSKEGMVHCCCSKAGLKK